MYSAKKSNFLPESFTVKTESTIDESVWYKLAAAVVITVILATAGYFMVKKSFA